MDDRVIKFRVGVVVIAALLVGGIMVVLFGDTRAVTRGGKTINMHFLDAPGVTEGTPVRKSGILIGRVTKVSFAEQGGVNVVAKIDREVKIYKNEIPQVSGSILGGDVVIQFIRMTRAAPAEPPPPQPLEKKTGSDGEEAPAKKQANRGPVDRPGDEWQEGDWVEGTVAPNAFQVISNLEGGMAEAISALSQAGNEVGKLAAGVNKILEENDEQIGRIVNKTDMALDTFQRTMNNIDDLLGDENLRQKIKDSIDGLPLLFDDTRTTINTLRTTVESVDRNMRNLEGFTEPLGERGPEMIARVDKTISRLDGLLSEMTTFGETLNKGEGSLGKLMRDPELYQHLNSAARNIDRLTRDLRPILEDARVFSDKIARRPSSLGLKGVFQKDTGIK